MNPFADISPYYDLLMQEVDYQEWTDYIMHLLDRAGVAKGSSLLDMACGTGTSAIFFARGGYKVSGMDLSPGMLEAAEAKAKKTNLNIRYFPGDIRKFSVKKKTKAVTCLFDSMNYLLNEKDFQSACKCAHKALSQPGAFIFDLNTIFALTRYWDRKLEVKEAGGVVSIWRNNYDLVNRYANLSLTLFTPQGKGYRRIDEFHREKAFALDEVGKMLETAGFGKIEVFRHLTTEPPQPNTIRVTLIAYKI